MDVGVGAMNIFSAFSDFRVSYSSLYNTSLKEFEFSKENGFNNGV